VLYSVLIVAVAKQSRSGHQEVKGDRCSLVAHGYIAGDFSAIRFERLERQF
jgi:hypothetical protein